jgi:hypothetical protein
MRGAVGSIGVGLLSARKSKKGKENGRRAGRDEAGVRDTGWRPFSLRRLQSGRRKPLSYVRRDFVPLGLPKQAVSFVSRWERLGFIA